MLRVVLSPIGDTLPPVDLRQMRSSVHGRSCRDGLENCKAGCADRDGRACWELGVLIGSGDQGPVLPNEAARYLKRSCDLNYTGGCTLLAINYLVDGGAAMQLDLGRRLADKGCTLGDATACRTAYMSHRNEGRDLAASYLRKACFLEPAGPGCR